MISSVKVRKVYPSRGELRDVPGPGRVLLEYNADEEELQLNVGGTWAPVAVSGIGSATNGQLLTNNNGTVGGLTLPAGSLVGTSASQSLTNKTGLISQWTNDSGYLTSVTSHSLLSATHGDTTAAAVQRGDLVTGQGASAAWARLAKGAANTILKSDGADLSWGAPGGTTQLLYNSAGTVVGDANLTWDPTSGLAVGKSVKRTSVFYLGKDTNSDTYSGVWLGTAANNPALSTFSLMTDNNSTYFGAVAAMSFQIANTEYLNITASRILLSPLTSNLVEQRNGTNAQTWRLYETYTNSTNYSRLSISCPTGGPITFASEALGSGTARPFRFTGGYVELVDINLALTTTTGTKIATATGQKLGFWNATPVVQQVLATGAGATVDNVITLLQTLGLCKQS